MTHIGKRKTKLNTMQKEQVFRLFYKEQIPVPFLKDLFKVSKNTIYRVVKVSDIIGQKRQQKFYDLRK